MTVVTNLLAPDNKIRTTMQLVRPDLQTNCFSICHPGAFGSRRHTCTCAQGEWWCLFVVQVAQGMFCRREELLEISNDHLRCRHTMGVTIFPPKGWVPFCCMLGTVFHQFLLCGWQLTNKKISHHRVVMFRDYHSSFTVPDAAAWSESLANGAVQWCQDFVQGVAFYNFIRFAPKRWTSQIIYNFVGENVAVVWQGVSYWQFSFGKKALKLGVQLCISKICDNRSYNNWRHQSNHLQCCDFAGGGEIDHFGLCFRTQFHSTYHSGISDTAPLWLVYPLWMRMFCTNRA